MIRPAAYVEPSPGRRDEEFAKIEQLAAAVAAGRSTPTRSRHPHAGVSVDWRRVGWITACSVPVVFSAAASIALAVFR